MKNYNKEEFILKLKNANWEACFYATDVGKAWTGFSDIFMSILNSVAPTKEVKLKQRTEPWVDSELLELMRVRVRYLYQFKKHNKSEDYKMYCSFRNQVQRYTKKVKSDFFSNKIEENRTNSRILWQQLKGLGYKNKKDDNSNIVLTIDGETYRDQKSVADYFNQCFSTVASALVQKLPSSLKLFDYNLSVFKDFYKTKVPENNKFYLKHVTEEFVHKELLQLNAYKSTGLNGIPAKFLKDGAEILKLPITWIINLSISENTVPNGMKVARVKPLIKKNSNLEVGNYRPVSILSIVSKILERAVYIQLENYLVENNILYEYQSGFRKSFSTDTCHPFVGSYKD